MGLVLVVVAATLVLGAVSLIYPFGRDQGEYAVIADSMLHGKVVYRDVFNVKPPMTAAVHALALAAFGHSMTSIRILDLIWTAATALALALLARRMFSRLWVAALAGSLYSFFYYQFGYWHTAQTDGWLALPVVVALLLVVRGMARSEGAPQTKPGPGWSWFSAGFLLGLATLMKYPAAVFVLLFAGILMVAWRRSLGQALKKAALVAAGFVVPLAVTFALIAGSGAMPAFIESQLRVVPGYLRLSSGGGIVGFIRWLLAGMPSAAIAGAGGLAALVTQATRRRGAYLSAAVVLLLMTGGAASVLTQGKFYIYHYLPLLPGFAVAVSGGAGVLARMRPRAVGLVALALLAGSVAAAVGPETAYAKGYRDLARVVAGRSTVREYWMKGHETANFSLRDDIMLADYIRENTAPDDPVFIWGFEPVVYFLARRPVVSRFIYTYPLVVKWAPDELRLELMDAYRETPAELFAVAHGDSMPYVTGHSLDSFRTLQEFAELRAYIDKHYVPEGKVGRFSLFRLRAGQ
ncbi:MAG: glycosyltransferase family 39 protein [candidate division WOR-3 bacterium]|nr:MAG: glycosyltransferase family 39 protein [candidate division WOR-3 bacterium]